MTQTFSMKLFSLQSDIPLNKITSGQKCNQIQRNRLDKITPGHSIIKFKEKEKDYFHGTCKIIFRLINRSHEYIMYLLHGLAVKCIINCIVIVYRA